MAKFERVEEIDVLPDKVWQVLSVPSSWDEFLPDVADVQVSGEATTGAAFYYTAPGGKQGAAHVVKADANRYLEVLTEVEGHQTRHRFTLAPRMSGLLGLGGANGTRVDYVMEYTPPGGFIGAFVAGGNPVDLMKIKTALDKLEKVAESPDNINAGKTGQLPTLKS